MEKFIPIGGRFELYHLIYEVREWQNCKGCACCVNPGSGYCICSDFGINRFPPCSAPLRKDGKDVIFVQVGESET